VLASDAGKSESTSGCFSRSCRIGFGDLGDAFEYIKKKKKKKKKLGSTVTPVSRRKMTVGRA